MSFKPKPAQQRTLDNIFAGLNPDGTSPFPPLPPVISTRQGRDGKSVICHRLLADHTTHMFRITPEGKAQPA